MNKSIEYTIKNSSLGSVLVARSESGICAILMSDESELLVDDLHVCFPNASIEKGNGQLETIAGKVVDFIENPKDELNVTLDIGGTDFQRKVWNALQNVPLGTTVSYKDIAKKLRKPRSVRAVAGACAANKLAVVIPCHRVVKSDGKLSGYRWGTDRKQKLLVLEGAI
jgi:AraC family transcriptional regulator of adaptative response/methylated-DNA-[protein]-cysteine methyltransferase